MDRIDEFVAELEALEKKYGLYIWGCGCCDSPRLMDSQTNETVAGSLEFLNDKYEFDRC